MKKIYLNLSLIVLIGAFLSGCAAYKPQLIQPDFQPVDLNTKLRSGEYEPKVENFYVILDKSGSEDETYRGYSKFAISNDFLYRMNMGIPDIDLMTGLRTFGETRRPLVEKTRLLYGPTIYTKEGFATALGMTSWGGGKSPADMALDAAGEDMVSFDGKTALIFVGDGSYERYDPAAAAKRVKNSYGDDVCIYTVLVGSEDPARIEIMRAIADAGECGFYQSAKYLETPEALADWIEDVFLAEVKAEVVEAVAVDSDGDGVFDDQDQCPNTPTGAPVNDRGCWIIENVEFDFDKASIKPQFYPILIEIADVMAKNPDISIRIDGHCDNTGAERYNIGLGERRAQEAKRYLVQQGMSEYRISTESFGYSRPIATNETDWGRQRNRRVEFKWAR